MEFREFDKIPRLRRGIVITEKIDGTNASVCIATELLADVAGDDTVLATRSVGCGAALTLRAGSRTRWLTRAADNYGFAAWAELHADELFELGEGHHFGEWWGRGIQIGYGLQERRFSLFNVGRWIEYEEQRMSDSQRVVPAPLNVVPVLARYPYPSLTWIDATIDKLKLLGSRAAPGFMRPEGIVVFHEASGQLFKQTIERDDEPKSRTITRGHAAGVSTLLRQEAA